MPFQSFGFFVFFCVAFAAYWALREHRRRMWWLLAVSVIFYALWNPWYIVLIAFTAGADYVFALRIEAAADARARRGWLIVSIVASLSLLCFFKYALFLAGSAEGLLGLFGMRFTPPAWKIVPPLGISFYTFETISYVIDVYRGRLKAERNVLNYALYIMFFPHLLAGPIVRPGQFLPQISRTKRFNWPRFELGVQLFMRGLLKKTVIADRFRIAGRPRLSFPGAIIPRRSSGSRRSPMRGKSTAISPATPTWPWGWRTPSASSSRGISTGLTSPTAWGNSGGRWHMTLSTWLRDYLYIPSGGSRGGSWRTYRNLLLTMGIAGLWHGASWNFVIFGLMHGVAMSLERACPQPQWTRHGLLKILRIMATFVFWCLSLVFFRSTTLQDACTMLARMFPPGFRPGGVAVPGLDDSPDPLPRPRRPGPGRSPAMAAHRGADSGAGGRSGDGLPLCPHPIAQH